jgi:hypothetical protein
VTSLDIPTTKFYRISPDQNNSCTLGSTSIPSSSNTQVANEKFYLSAPSTSKAASSQQNLLIFPFHISPVSSLKKKTSNRGRKPSKCAVVTSSPIKEELTQSKGKGTGFIKQKKSSIWEYLLSKRRN